MDYLTRYLNGEYEQVWQELINLGSAIREGELYVQAEAVARETMRRVRKNVETLIERLQELNFKFEETPLTPPELVWSQHIQELEQQLGPLPLSLKIFYEEMGEVSFRGLHPKLSNSYHESEDDFSEEDAPSVYYDPLVV